jgi:hypothetical protein
MILLKTCFKDDEVKAEAGTFVSLGREGAFEDVHRDEPWR